MLWLFCYNANMSKVYLAGTMRGDWADRVMEALSVHTFFYPKKHGLKDPKNYTRWDLGMISNSSLVFAYMDRENPSGVGLALEVGFAKGIKVPVVFVCEKEVQHYRYFEIVRHASDFCFDELHQGIEFVQKNGTWNLSWGGLG